MEQTLVYTAFGLAGLTSLVTLFLFLSRTKLQEKLVTLEEKLTLEQAKRSELEAATTATRKKAEPVKTPPERQKLQEELIELRKNSAHQKNEIKQLKNDLRQAEALSKDYLHRTEVETFKLKAENQALIDRMRDFEINSSDKKKAQALEQELGELKNSSQVLRSDLAAAQAKLKSERSAFEKQKQMTEELQKQLREFKQKYPDETSPEIQKIDPKVLERWKDRALTARHMYRMMRQMRELSDLKLSTYQDAIFDVSRTLLTLKGAKSPDVGPHENKADRFLAEAWSTIQSDTTANT
jgi:chromosome segregation ATPase